MHIRAQNAAIIVRRPALGTDFVQFEVFEVSPPNTNVMKAEGKLLCSYPGPAIQVPVDIFMDECFLRELSSFLVQMDVDILDSIPTASKAGSVVHEVRETAHPKYISGLLVGILRGFGQPVVVDRITKRVGDEVLWDKAFKPWRRSPLWLALRVTLQSSMRLDNIYKPFILYFHAYLLRQCLQQGFPSELLYVMRAKMARRLSKLGPAVPQHLNEFVHASAKDTEVLLSKRWIAFQSIGPTGSTLQLGTLDFIADTRISLNSSYAYLTKLRSVSYDRPQISFKPQGSHFFSGHNFSQFSNGQLASAISKGQHIAIIEFESFVEKNLESWVTSSNSQKSLPMMASCIQQYYAGVKDLYRDNAEDNSIMILTIMDLWVALDILAIRQCPLLKQYSPEIPTKFLHGLLLHGSSTINRALHIEDYLCRRHTEALQVPSIFSNNVDHSCFSVKFFQTSQNLNRLHNEINAHAHQARENKRSELSSLNRKSQSLLRQAAEMSHESPGICQPTKAKSKTCQRCTLERQAKKLKIRVHEWPLPSSAMHAQHVVFELSPPEAFSVWRDITYKILRDIGLPSVPDSHDKPQILLSTFSDLRSWAAQGHRVTVGSTTKSFVDQTHYKRVRIPAEEPSVLVKNGLKLEVYDSSRKAWVVPSFSESSVGYLCTPHIQTTSPYSRLHGFVSGSQHTPNDIIAAQADCPKEISLHEFIAFSGLRSGPRLQWLNIARELASPSLSFRREEVHTLITQAAWQLGPLSDGVREWHIDLGLSSFGNALLRELESLLQTIKASWLEEVSLRTIGV